MGIVTSLKNSMALKISITVGVILLVILWFVFLTPSYYAMSGVSASIDAEKLRSLELGYSESQVKAILGRPIKRVESHDSSQTVTLYYSKIISYAFRQPNLMIVLRNGIVDVIEVQKTVLWGDDVEGYYYLKSRQNLLESDDFDEVF